MESVVALFSEPNQARQALDRLQARGFAREHLGFAMTDAVAENDIAHSTGVSPEAGAAAGSGAAIRGFFIGALGGIVLLIPVWLILLKVLPQGMNAYTDGAFMAMLLVAIGGAGMGFLFGALTGTDHGDYVKLLRNMGVPAAQAERFQQGIRQGNVMVIARDPSGAQTDEALTIMRNSGAISLDDATGRGRLQSERVGQGGH